MSQTIENLLSSNHTFSSSEQQLKNKFKYLNIMILFAFIFVPPAIVIGYFIEGLALTLIYSLTFLLTIFSFVTLRKDKHYYKVAVWAYILAPTIMISFALFLSDNNFTRVILPLFPIVVGYFFLDKRSGLLIALYSLILIVASLFTDIGLEPKDWISTILLIIMMIFVFNFFHNMHEDHTKVLEVINQELKDISVTDKLTQIKNRRGLDEALANEMVRFNRFRRPLGVMILDIDHFKVVNDTYGHLAGDEVLKKLSTLLSSNLRDTDILGRWGGEEFLVICPETTLEGTKKLSAMLHKIVEAYNFDQVGQITISIGYGIAKENDICESLLNRIDKYLYYVKQNGRNGLHGDDLLA